MKETNCPKVCDGHEYLGRRGNMQEDCKEKGYKQ